MIEYPVRSKHIHVPHFILVQAKKLNHLSFKECPYISLSLPPSLPFLTYVYIFCPSSSYFPLPYSRFYFLLSFFVTISSFFKLYVCFSFCVLVQYKLFFPFLLFFTYFLKFFINFFLQHFLCVSAICLFLFLPFFLFYLFLPFSTFQLPCSRIFFFQNFVTILLLLFLPNVVTILLSLNMSLNIPSHIFVYYFLVNSNLNLK